MEKIIIKYINNSATQEEKESLEEWIKIPENKKVFAEYVKLHHAIVSNSVDEKDLSSLRGEILFKETVKQVSLQKKKNKIIALFRYVAAAVLIGVLITAYVYRNEFFDTKEIMATTTVKPGVNKAVLRLEDGTLVSLKKGDLYKDKKAESDGTQLVYHQSTNGKSVKTEYNFLTIPRGGEFFLQLADGTKVWLNSDTKLKYPTSFSEGKDREVELVYGEAYFDVSPSNLHNGSVFKVINRLQEIKVLGTEFNVKAYDDEDCIYTTLVEGSVNIKNGNGKQHNLNPNEQAVVNIKTKKIKVKKVNVYPEVSWIKGEFSFKGKTLFEIMKIIERWYNVKVIFENNELKKVKFRGIISKKQNLEDILRIMKSKTINNYEIKNNLIILK